MISRPTLVVVSGPGGAGKTTLAHAIARAVGCPAICRDEIKEGMVHAVPGFEPSPGDELTTRTLPAFFGVLDLLLRAGVTTVAEAAYQDHVWRPRLEPLSRLARIRVVRCVVDAETALARMRHRRDDDPVRRPHADAAALSPGRASFAFLSVAPWIEVDTTDGYTPGLDEVLAFVNAKD